MTLADLLTFRRGENLFLPAHGRGKALPRDIKKLLSHKPGFWDLPDLPDIGGPTSLGGAVSTSQFKAALSVGAQKGWYGVNGATGLLQASLLAMAKPKQSVLMPRNVHRSIIQACVLGDLNPVLFDLPFLEDRGHFLPPDFLWFEKIIEALINDGIDISAVVLTSPTYNGYSSDLLPIIELSHKKGWPVLVDEAHGTYFLSSAHHSLPKSALSAGADLVVHSLHKSAKGLVQTAALWWQGDFVDPELIERSLIYFQTTSPSSLLLSSCESALMELTSHSGRRNLKQKIIQATNISLRLRDFGLPILENNDPLKIVLNTSIEGISGLAADQWFINRGLIAELPEPGTITFCLGFSNHRGLAMSIKRKWDELIRSNLPRNTFPPFLKPPFPLLTNIENKYLSSFRGKLEKVSLSNAVGRVSADLISPYPPGVPIVFPGEFLDQSRIDWMITQKAFWPDQIPSELLVKP